MFYNLYVAIFTLGHTVIHPTCHFCTLRFMINTLGNIFAPGLIYSGHVLVFASGVTNSIGLVLIQVHTKCNAQVTHDILHSSVNYWHASAKAARICSCHAANFILVRIYFAAWPFTPVCQKDIMLCLNPLLFSGCVRLELPALRLKLGPNAVQTCLCSYPDFIGTHSISCFRPLLRPFRFRPRWTFFVQGLLL